jgi:peptide/nickel transport system permease protein
VALAQGPLAREEVFTVRTRRAPYLEALLRLMRARVTGLCLAFLFVCVFVAIFAPLIAPYDPLAQNPFTSLAGPSGAHWLGTDQIGRDVLSRLLYGTRVSIGIGFGAVLLGSVIGVTLGLVAGFFRGIIDEVIMRAVEVLLAFPGLILALGLLAALGQSVSTLIIAIGVFSIPGLARLVRSRVLSVREEDYVLAARTLGAGNARIVLTYIWPNSMAPVIVQMSIAMGAAVLIEAALSFLNVGVPPPTPSWGSMLQESFEFLSTTPLLSIVPGAAIFLLVLSFNLLGDGLRDALNPQLRTSGH